MSWRQSKRVRRYTLDKSGSLRRSLLSKHWFWLSHGAREISFNFVRYRQGKNRLHQFYQSKAFDGRRKTHWKQRNISFLEKWRFGFMKRQRHLSLITSQPTRLTPLHPISLSHAVFRLERFTEVREFTYVGKHFPCVNANWYFGKWSKRQKKFDQGKSCNYPVIRHGYSW